MTSTHYQSEEERAELQAVTTKHQQQREVERISQAADDLIRNNQWSTTEAIRRAAREAYNLGYQHGRNTALSEAYSAFKDVWRMFPTSPRSKSPLSDS